MFIASQPQTIHIGAVADLFGLDGMDSKMAGRWGFVLVHGSGLDSRCWQDVAPLLKSPALAVDLPGRATRPADLSKVGLSDFADAVVDDIDAFADADRIVLVGHSMGGLTVPTVALRRPDRVAHLVFVSSFLPQEGVSMAAGLPGLLGLLSRLGPAQDRPTAMNPRLAKTLFCNDMTREQAAVAVSLLVPEAPKVMLEPVSRRGLPPASVLPRTYVKLSRDRSFRPKRQDRAIQTLGDCAVRTVQAGHLAMISRPAELAAALNALTQGGETPPDSADDP